MFASGKTSAASTGGYQISRSLRFNSADSAYLNRTPASATNQQTWTYSTWIKRGSLDTNQFFFQQNSGASDTGYFGIFLTTGNTLSCQGWVSTWRVTTQVFRDVSAWYHIVVAVDTTQATANNRIRIYVNSSEVTSFTTTTNPTQNSNTGVNGTGAAGIGKEYNTSGYFNGYTAETYLIDGQALTPSSFGETNAQTGVWQPKAYSGSYGTNGFYLNFSDNSNTTAATLGKDYSGNGNNWTPNNFSVTAGAGNDSLVDSPTLYGTDTGVGGTVRGNYATLNPLDVAGTGTIIDGNLQLNGSSGAWYQSRCGFGLTSGKWYWEVYIVATNEAINGVCIGIASSAVQTAGYNTANQWSYNNNSGGRKGLNTVSTAYGTAFITGNTVGVAFDADAGSITFYVNNSSQGVAASSGLPNPAFPTVSAYGTDKVAMNFGQRPFAYTAPSGFKALCTQNLPTPTIGATTATLAGKYFNPVLYTGNGTTQTISGVGFQPDLVWCKGRSNAYWHSWIDAVRGRGFASFSNVTNAEFTSPVGKELTAFTSDGFSLGPDDGFSINSSGAPFVAWNWKANGSGSSNTAGSITSTVSANTTSGFSVVTYTGTGANATVGHGLGSIPKMMIVKRRSTADTWRVYHATIGNTRFLNLNEDATAGTASTVWNNTTPTSSVLSIGTDSAVNGSGSTYVAYCFAEIDGYSKFSSYDGNGSADGPFVFTGFRPAYVVLKSSSGVVQVWIVVDSKRFSYNVVSGELYPSTSGAESSGQTRLDLVSNGFKIRTADTAFNQSGCTYIYMAFAEVPTKFALAR